MGPRNNVRNNHGWFQKQASAYITRQLRKVANEVGVNVKLIIADELERVYKDNVRASFMPSSTQGASTIAYNESQKALEEKDREDGIKNPRRHRKKQTYHHTGTLLEAIHSEIGSESVKIVIDKEYEYEKPVYEGSRNGKASYGKTTISAEDVWSILINGAPATYSDYPYYDEEGKVRWAKNYGVVPHPFELHTQAQMTGFLKSLETEIQTGTYSKRRRYKIKK